MSIELKYHEKLYHRFVFCPENTGDGEILHEGVEF